MIPNNKAMESGFIVYLDQLKRKQERSKKQEKVAVCQTVADARVENKAALVQAN
jgi:hypothetical protein